MMIMTIGI